MVEHMHSLPGPVEFLAWISLANVLIGMVTACIIATTKAPPRVSSSLAFLMAFVLIYGRSFYRNLTGAPTTYTSACLHLTIGVACIWKAVQSVRYARLVEQEGAARIAEQAAQASETAAKALRSVADVVRSSAIDRSAEANERTAAATERIADSTEALTKE